MVLFAVQFLSVFLLADCASPAIAERDVLLNEAERLGIVLSEDELRTQLDVCSRMDAYPRPLDLRVVLCIDQVKQDEQFVPALREVDTVMAWTWTGKNIARHGDESRDSLANGR